MLDPISLTHKQRIAYQFGKAAAVYDDNAHVQLDIGFDTLQMLPESLGRTLDIGCGTGRLSKQLIAKSDTLLALDLSEGMSRHAHAQLESAKDKSKSTTCITADAESLPLGSSTIDTVFSSMALQWCTPLTKVLTEIKRVLTIDGKAYISLLADGSLEELNKSWKRVDGISRVNQFMRCDDIVSQLESLGLKAQVSLKSYVTWHNHVRELLGSVRSIGANVVLENSHHSALKRSSLAQLQNQYEAHFGLQGRLPLSYQVIFLVLSK